MPVISWDLAQPVASTPFYAFARSPVIVWQSVGQSDEPTFGELSGTAASTSAATGTLSAFGELSGLAASTSRMTGSLTDPTHVWFPVTPAPGTWTPV